MAKCRICNVLIEELSDDFIKTKNRVYYHTNCYQERELKKGIPIDIILEFVEVTKKGYREDCEKKIKKYKDSNIRDGIKPFTDWVQREYDISFLPTSFLIKIASIANGTYKSLKEPITYIDLLDMLQRRKKQLDIKLASKKFDSGLHRFYYDLAVVLSQYDSYKKWKIAQEGKKQEVIEAVELQKRVNQGMDILKINNKSDYEDSIENALEDIFG